MRYQSPSTKGGRCGRLEEEVESKTKSMHCHCSQSQHGGVDVLRGISHLEVGTSGGYVFLVEREG